MSNVVHQGETTVKSVLHYPPGGWDLHSAECVQLKTDYRSEKNTKINKEENEIKYADCWSPSERKLKSFFENLKGRFFSPIVTFLVRMGVTANMISYASAFLGIVSAVYLLYDLKIASVLLFLSLAIDGIDGSVARATNRDSFQGSITDSFSDQMTITATSISMLATGLVDSAIGGLYIAIYPVVITFSILRNIIKKPACYVLRPRIVVYCTIWLYAFFNINLLNFILLPLSIILLFQAINDFYVLRDNLNG